VSLPDTGTIARTVPQALRGMTVIDLVCTRGHLDSNSIWASTANDQSGMRYLWFGVGLSRGHCAVKLEKYEAAPFGALNTHWPTIGAAWLFQDEVLVCALMERHSDSGVVIAHAPMGEVNLIELPKHGSHSKGDSYVCSACVSGPNVFVAVAESHRGVTTLVDVYKVFSGEAIRVASGLVSKPSRGDFRGYELRKLDDGSGGLDWAFELTAEGLRTSVLNGP